MITRSMEFSSATLHRYRGGVKHRERHRDSSSVVLSIHLSKYNAVSGMSVILKSCCVLLYIVNSHVSADNAGDEYVLMQHRIDHAVPSPFTYSGARPSVGSSHSLTHINTCTCLRRSAVHDSRSLREPCMFSFQLWSILLVRYA